MATEWRQVLIEPPIFQSASPFSAWCCKRLRVTCPEVRERDELFPLQVARTHGSSCLSFVELEHWPQGGSNRRRRGLVSWIGLNEEAHKQIQTTNTPPSLKYREGERENKRLMEQTMALDPSLDVGLSPITFGPWLQSLRGLDLVIVVAAGQQGLPLLGRRIGDGARDN